MKKTYLEPVAEIDTFGDIATASGFEEPGFGDIDIGIGDFFN